MAVTLGPQTLYRVVRQLEWLANDRHWARGCKNRRFLNEPEKPAFVNVGCKQAEYFRALCTVRQPVWRHDELYVRKRRGWLKMAHGRPKTDSPLWLSRNKCKSNVLLALDRIHIWLEGERSSVLTSMTPLLLSASLIKRLCQKLPIRKLGAATPSSYTCAKGLN